MSQAEQRRLAGLRRHLSDPREKKKTKKKEVWLEARFAPSALAETDACLRGVVVLNKHCSAHVYTLM